MCAATLAGNLRALTGAVLELQTNPPRRRCPPSAAIEAWRPRCCTSSRRSAPIECRGRCAPLCAPSCAALRLGGCRGRTRVRPHKVHVFPPSTKRWLVLGASAKRTGCGDGAVMVMGRRRKATRNKVSTSAPSRTHARTRTCILPIGPFLFRPPPLPLAINSLSDTHPVVLAHSASVA